MPKSNLELKVGLFALSGLIILSIIIFSIGDFYFIRPTYNLRAQFGYIAGVETGSPVRLAGVEVGEVKNITYFFDENRKRTQVEMILRLDKTARVEKDARIFINTLGLLGEKYIEIEPGSADSMVLPHNSIVIGIDPIPLEKLTERTQNIVASLEKSVRGLAIIMDDEEVIADFKAALNNISEVSGSLNEILKESKGDISVGLKSFRSSSEDLETILAKIRKGEGTMGKFVSDDALYNHLEEMIIDLKENPWKLLSKPKKKKSEK